MPNLKTDFKTIKTLMFEIFYLKLLLETLPEDLNDNGLGI